MAHMHGFPVAIGIVQTLQQTITISETAPAQCGVRPIRWLPSYHSVRFSFRNMLPGIVGPGAMAASVPKTHRPQHPHPALSVHKAEGWQSLSFFLFFIYFPPPPMCDAVTLFLNIRGKSEHG